MGARGSWCLAYHQVNLKPYLSVSEAEPALALAAAASAYGTEALQTGKYSQPSLEGRLPLETRSTPACPSRIRRIHRPKKKKKKHRGRFESFDALLLRSSSRIKLSQADLLIPA